ncbi:MAG: hypothetical protein ACT4P8_06815 [Betaproteobacteria bacterium]
MSRLTYSKLQQERRLATPAWRHKSARFTERLPRWHSSMTIWSKKPRTA